ncbi:MAG: restriction endonuclease subunit S [Fusobacteriaceae bacterium]
MSKKKEVTIEDKLKGAIIPKEEQPYEIPDNWELVKITSIMDIRDGTHDSPKYVEKGFPLVTSKNLKNNEIDFKNVKYISKEDMLKINQRSKVEKGDVLYAMIGTIGNPVYVNVESLNSYAVKNVAIFKPFDKKMGKYIFNYLNSFNFQQIVNSKLKGSTQKFIPLNILRSLKLPLPPLEEQERIVNKLDSMLGRINEAKELIAQAKETFKNRRASILNLAFSGELTRKWRESNSVESSKILLENLNKEKIRLWEEECEKALEEGKKKPSKPKLPSVEEMVISKEEQSYEIPKSWEWIKIEKVIQLISGRDVSSNLCNSDEKGIPYILGASNIKENRFLAERWIETPVVISKKNDILLSVKGTIGKIYLQKESEINISRQIMALRAYSVLEKYYLMYFLENNVEKFKEEGNGLIPGISREIILNKLIQLPPLEEQKEIVRILNETLKREKKIKEILEIENMLELLEKSILDKAFKGELGTQNDTDSDIYDTLKSYNLTKGE